LIESRLTLDEGGNRTGWFILAQILLVLITVVRVGQMSEQEKELEILILTQQLAIL
jgi:hypothetical protein